MTEKEIVQALRRCQFGAPCARCPAVSYKNCMDEMHKCAADLIERLTAENVALREKAPQWISVEERRPEPGKRVLATDGIFVGEDAGLSPQACAEAREIEETLSRWDYSISRMVELMKADVEGRVLILPCAPDAIYWEKVGGILAQSRFEGLHVYEDGTIKYAGYGMEICAEDIGKTVFLSREEAEKALQEMEGKKDGV